MPHPVIRSGSRVFEAGFDRIREELGVPPVFPAEVLDLAERARPRPDLSVGGTGVGSDGGRLDARGLLLVAIDPPGATDLDQAVAIDRRNDGYRVHYAIADVGAFVVPGGPVDAEARARGTTLYSPDGRAPLHPPVLSEDRASLLPETDKPALLWTIDLDGDGEPVEWRMVRALVRVRAAISYEEAQSRIGTLESASARSGPAPHQGATGHGSGPQEADGWPGSLPLLAEVGRLRLAREADRGGISLAMASQTVVEHDGSYALRFDQTLPVEAWNAQISLLTGMVAARTMVAHRVGILRTLPTPQPRAIDGLRATARALGLRWPSGTGYPDFIRQLQPNDPAANAFMLQATRTLRGAGYVGFDGVVPDEPGHGAIASVYAHVTAPLRRLVDRFANEILLALFAGHRPPSWALDALDELPQLMASARRRESALERATLDYAEALVLSSSVGRHFIGVVVDVGGRRAQVQIAEPAVVASIDGDGRTLAEEVSLELMAVDTEKRSIRFEPVRDGE